MRRAPIALVIALAALAFAPCLQNGFVNWDDNANIVDNARYRGLGAEQLRWMFTTTHMGHYQPLAWVTLGADYLLWRMNPLGYHLTSVLFHIANAVLFYLVALMLFSFAAQRRGTNERAAIPASAGAADSGAAPILAARAAIDERWVRIAAAFAAGLFALHPLRVESVAWVTERRDVVSGFFFLIAILAYVRGAADSSRGWRFLSITAFAAALASKATTIVLPILLLFIDEHLLRQGVGIGRTRARRLTEKAPYFALAAIATILGLRAQHSAVAFPALARFGIEERVATALYGLAFYVRKTIAPLDLTPAHALHDALDLASPPILASAALVALVTIAVVALRRRRPALMLAWAGYVVAIAPVLGVVQKFSYAAADRYSYLGGLAFALIGGGALLEILERGTTKGRRTAAIAGSACLLAALSLVTARQCRVWRDSESLWRHTISVDPANAIAHDNLGHELIRQRRLDEARASLAAALVARPGFSDALAGLGQIALLEGDAARARTHLENALAAWSENPVALTNLGVAKLQLGDRSGAIDSFRAAARAEPAFFDAWRNLGVTLLAAGDSAAAADALARADALRR